MKIVLYGMPCSGKTTFLKALKGIKFISGSETLNRLSNNTFHLLPEEEKRSVRIAYTEYLAGFKEENIISDGHYSFEDNVVFTEADGDIYDVFIYLYCPPAVLKERLKASEKNSKFVGLSTERLEQWQDFEIESLREECHKRYKDFYVIGDSPTCEEFSEFIDLVKEGYSSYSFGEELVSKIRKIYPNPCKINIVDGDKTLIEEDSFRICSRHLTNAFKGDFYTGYQAFKFSVETRGLSLDFDRLKEIKLNRAVYNKIKDEKYVVISSGITEIWQKIAQSLNIKNVFASTFYSADTKYYAVRLLQRAGYEITAYGDSRNDYYMLKAAREGYLYIGSRLSRSLYNTDTRGIKLIYDKTPYILYDNDKSLEEKISLCKSDSGVRGNRLAEAHRLLGKKTGEKLRELLPNKNAAVLVLERGGRFFGDGVYSGFGGIFYPFNPKKEGIPNLEKPSVIVVVDSVINSGKSMLSLTAALKNSYPESEIIIATNVIQRGAMDILKDYKIFAVRISDNFFVGENRKYQSGDKGPDTADRLFNLI